AALLAAVLRLGPGWVVGSLGLWPEQPPAEGKAPLASIREDEALGGRGSRRAMPKAGQKPRPPELRGEEATAESGPGLTVNEFVAPEAGPALPAPDPAARDA